jgi:hypothetical protein
MNLFARASAGLALTPGERAFLKVVDGFVFTAGGAAFAAVAQLLSAGGVVDWRKVAAVAGVTFATSLVVAMKKFFTAQGDAPLAAAAGMVESQLATVRIPFNAPAVAPTTVTVTPDPATMSASAAAANGV